jgi:hypothetical protein
VSDDRAIGPGHNNPPAPKYELRRSGGISCDYAHPKRSDPYPRRFCRYWRIYRDGKMIDSFLTKANAIRALRRMREGGDDG